MSQLQVKFISFTYLICSFVQTLNDLKSCMARQQAVLSIHTEENKGQVTQMTETT